MIWILIFLRFAVFFEPFLTHQGGLNPLYRIVSQLTDQLTGLRYDREDLIHPDELKKVQKIQQTLKKSESISKSKYSTIQRWKHGKSNKYIMLSMVWEVDIPKDIAIILIKPIDLSV